MKDFDVARAQRETADRSFQVGGHTFTYKAAVSPEAIITWNEAVTGNGAESEREWLDLFDSTVVAILEVGQEDAWAEIRDPKAAHPLNISDIRDVLAWLIEQATGRPTGEPSGSSNGSEKTETGLKVVSSSPAETLPV